MGNSAIVEVSVLEDGDALWAGDEGEGSLKHAPRCMKDDSFCYGCNGGLFADLLPICEDGAGDDAFSTAQAGDSLTLESILARKRPAHGELGDHLQISSARGHIECVSLLLAYGAPVDYARKGVWFPYSDGETALMAAASSANIRVVQMLVEARASLSLKDADGRTALDRASPLRDLTLDRRQLSSDKRLLAAHPWAQSATTFHGARSSVEDYLMRQMTALAAAAAAELLADEDLEASSARSKTSKKKERRRRKKKEEEAASAAAGSIASASPTSAAALPPLAECRHVSAMPPDAVPAHPAPAEAPAEAPVRAPAELPPTQVPPVEVPVEVPAKVPAAASTAVASAEHGIMLRMAAEEGAEPPDDFVCPITQELMVDPCFAADGHTYERHAIERWLQTKSTSPMSGCALTLTAVFPNHLLRRQICEWQEGKRDLARAAFRS